jgi:outer membrane protein OmpA-like peptidoglycan-associated protein
LWNHVASVLALVAFPAISFAQSSLGPIAADPEMVNPRFGFDSVPGVGLPGADIPGTWRWGVIAQFERNPVTGYRLDQEVGTIVANRIGFHLGASVDVASFATVRLVAPLAANWGSQIEQLQADGVGLGGPVLGVAFNVPTKTPYFGFGVHADLILPSASGEADGSHRYIGEASVRGDGGATLRGTIPVRFNEGNEMQIDLSAGASVVGRQVIVTNQDFDYGSELWLRQGARVKLPWIPLNFTQSMVVRGGFQNFFQGGAENGLEVMGGVQIPIRNIAFNTHMTIDAMAGRGTNQGYGTTDLRVLAGVTFTRNPGRKKVVEVVKVERPPPVIPPREEPEPEPEWTEAETAHVVEDKIVIDDPIEFLVDTANILEHSLPVLEDVAFIMNNEYRIRHLVIEGHASEEGSFEYNYELSTRRAESVFKQLVRNGVAPDRMSYKGYGEVRPKVKGDTEDALSVNRRVEFTIVGMFDQYDLDVPLFGGSTPAPWSGANVEMRRLKGPQEELDEFEEARRLEEERKRREDRFEDPEVDDSFDFDEDAREAAEEEEAAFEGDSFELEADDDGEDFDFEGASSDDEPAEEDEDRGPSAPTEPEIPEDATNEPAPADDEAAATPETAEGTL